MLENYRNDSTEGSDPAHWRQAINVFDEAVFAHTSNGTLLAIRPEHIILSEARTVGAIPATVKDWELCGMLCRVILSVITDGRTNATFYADLPAVHPLVAILREGMTLYMRFSWDKVREIKEHTRYYHRPRLLSAA